MSDKHPEKPALDRRGFLGAGLGGAAAATAVVLPAGPAVAAENDEQKKKARYQESEHVKTYYRVNRY